MGVLRCTAKYRRLFGLPENLADPSPPVSALGEWYGNSLNVGHGRYLHYMSERARLSVIVRLRHRQTAERRFAEALSRLLADLGLDARQVEREVATLDSLAYGRARSKSVLGSMRDQAASARLHLERGLSLPESMLRLARTPCGPLDYDSPDRVAPELVRQHWRGSRLVN
jgi:hypothetical protein